MADAGGSCLSDLSDDLLRHILSLARARDRAATAVLSRRWLRLWRTSGDVYIDSRSFTGDGGCSSPDDPDEGEAFLRGAEKALAAAAALGPITRLTFSIAEDSKIILLRQCRQWGWKYNLMEALVSNPAARRVEELQIEVKPMNTRCTLSIDSLPSQALRVLRITHCSRLKAAPPPPGAAAATAFPMLVDLHLQDCSVPLVDLQSIIDACPRLSTLHLASSDISMDDEQLVGQLLIPAVSDLVLAGCTYGDGFGYNASLELDVPRLKYFRYRGSVQQAKRLSLKPQASSNMIQVDLHLTYDYHDYDNDTPTRNLFWPFIRNFDTAKHLTLKLDNFTTDDLGLEDKASQDELLGGLSFSLLEQLELEAGYRPGETAMVMLADLLHCCPMVRDLRIKLTKQNATPWVHSESSSIDMEARVHFDKSVSAFRNRRRRRSMVSLAGQNDDSYDAFVIPGLTGDEHSFSCLQSHLKRVSLQFFRDEPNCLGVQLAKFFAENAMVLQEMHIDDGCQEMMEHVNFSVRRWIANMDNGNNQLTVKDC